LQDYSVTDIIGGTCFNGLPDMNELIMHQESGEAATVRSDASLTD
jgi:hypothetical protein